LEHDRSRAGSREKIRAVGRERSRAAREMSIGSEQGRDQGSRERSRAAGKGVGQQGREQDRKNEMEQGMSRISTTRGLEDSEG
jgi:hypothetical protein